MVESNSAVIVDIAKYWFRQRACVYYFYNWTLNHRQLKTTVYGQRLTRWYPTNLYVALLADLTALGQYPIEKKWTASPTPYLGCFQLVPASSTRTARS